MKRFFFILLATISSLSTIAQDSASINIMTFNIRYDNPSDNEFNWNKRKELVTETILSSGADIIGVQEALVNQVIYLDSVLADFDYFGRGRDDGFHGGEFCPIYYNTKKYKLEVGNTHWLSETPGVPGSKSWDAACTRIITWVLLKDLKTEELFYVFNTHFDHESEKARKESAKYILDLLKDSQFQKKLILTGDFNMCSSDKAYKKLTSKIFDTEALSIEKHKGPAQTYIGFPYIEDEKTAIDFIFVNSKDIKVNFHHTISYNKNGFYPSDHLPVMINVNFTSY